ncbi:MAG: PAS domain S-box protein [Mariniphaga sp.]
MEPSKKQSKDAPTKNEQELTNNLLPNEINRLEERQSSDTENWYETDRQKLIHELEVHATELEKQNEELKIADLKIQASETRFRRLFESAKDGILILDAENGQIVEANPYLIDLIGYTREEILGKELWEIGTFKNIAASKESFSILQNKEYIRFENMPLDTKSGEPIEVEFVSNVYLVDSKKVIQCNIRNITDRIRTEKALKKVQDRLNNVIEATNVGTWEWNIQTGEVIINERWAEIIGYSLDEISPISINTWFKFAHPEDLIVSEQLLELVFNCKSSYYDLECRMNHRNGNWVWIHDKGKVIEWTIDGKPLLMAGTHSDISNRKQTEQNLIISEKRANSLIEAIPVMMFSLDRNGEYLDFKANIEDLYYQKGSIIGKNNHDVAPPEFAELIDKKMELAFETDKMQVFEYQLPVPERGLRSYEARMIPIGIEEVIVIVRDITDQKMIKDALAEKSQLYYAMFEKNQAVKLLIDPADGTIVDANTAASQFYGYSLQDMKSINIFNINVLSPIEISEEMQQSMTGQKSYHKFRHRLSTGEIRDVEVYSSPICISGRELLHSIIHDVTDRKRIEDQLKESENRLKELNATKDKFFSIIGHDLKNPFNAIIGFSNILLDQIKEKDYKGIAEYADIIYRSSLRAMSLLSDLLEWSQLQTGKLTFTPTIFDLVKLIDDVTELANDAALQKNILILNDLPGQISLFADKSMIGSILRNLISNAVKFSNLNGQIKISVTKGLTDFIISVHDKGVGIKEETIEKLFRIEETYSTPGTLKETGTGLGLLLCKELVQKHGGKIWVESTLGIGSTFFFTIPKIPK